MNIPESEPFPKLTPGGRLDIVACRHEEALRSCKHGGLTDLQTQPAAFPHPGCKHPIEQGAPRR